MTGKVIDSSATSILILILPIACLIVLLFKAWPLLLALFIISIIVRVWQQYQWQQWSKQVNPYFNQLIKENQGCLTPLDLSIKANLSGSAARRYLDKKAEEFGAQRQVYEDKGPMYYFLTASALGSIFEESEPPLDELESESSTSNPLTASALGSIFEESEPPLDELESESFTSNASQFPEPTITPSESESSTRDFPEPSTEKEPSLAENGFSTSEIEDALEPMPKPEQEQTESFHEDEDVRTDVRAEEQEASLSLIQAELAKRLDVHSSTVGKRKSDPDFSEWSQSRDPEGIAWEYSPETKEFLPVQKQPESEQ